MMIPDRLTHGSATWKPFWPALALLPLAAGYRVLLAWLTVQNEQTLPSWMVNFTPVAALALCGGRFLPRRLALTVPLGLLLLSDWVVDWLYGANFFSPEVLGPCVCVLALGAGGLWLRRHAVGAGALLAATVAGSSMFYVVTNTLSWLGEPRYARALVGWVQALTAGLPGYPPTWIFFRNALVSDLLVSMLLAATCLHWRQRERRPAGSARQATAWDEFPA